MMKDMSARSVGRRSGADQGRTWWRFGAPGAAAAAAIAVGALTAVLPSAAAALCAAVLLAALVLAARPRFGTPELSGKRFRWVVAAWVFVLIEPIGHFTGGRTQLTAVSGNPSVENVLNLLSFGTIGALSLWSLRSNRFYRWPPLILLGLPLLSLLSAAWSLAATVTLGFSFELLNMVFLATLTGAIITVDSELGRSLIRRMLRAFVVSVATLCVLGLVVRSGWDLSETPARFSWPGTNTLAAAGETGAALIVLLFGGRREIGFGRRTVWALLVLFGVCLYFAHGRTILAGLAVALPFGYWYASAQSGPVRRIAGALTIVAVIVVLILSFGGALGDYLYRGETHQQVFGLNGRLGIWTTTVSQLHSAGRWLFGYGLSGSRVLLASSIAWAGDAHSAWVETLLSLGLTGVIVGIGLLAWLGARLFRASRPGAYPRVLGILFVYLLAMSPVATGFASPGPEPGMAFAMLGLFFAATVASERVSSPAIAVSPPPFGHAVSPVPA